MTCTDKISVYAINLAKRKARKASVISQFANREEFHLTVEEATIHKIGSLGLWRSILKIVNQANKDEKEYIIICEDDHVFTPHYSKEKLLSAIDQSIERHADLLLGGVSWLTTCIPINENLYWIEKFSGSQFVVIFKKFYRRILDAFFQEGDTADFKLAALSDQVYFLYPFISIQKDFGHSDATQNNNVRGKVEGLFIDAMNRVDAINKVSSFYKDKISPAREKGEKYGDLSNILIPTYIVNWGKKGSKRRLSNIESKLKNDKIFDVRIFSPPRYENTIYAYCSSIKKIVRQAKVDDDDVIIICEDNHTFTKEYSGENLVRHIINAAWRGTGILCGGLDDVETAVPASKDCFWFNGFSSSPFLVLYRSVFDKILNKSLNEYPSYGEFFREITSNKMVIFPFISKRERIDNIDIKCQPDEITEQRLYKIQEMAELSSHV